MRIGIDLVQISRFGKKFEENRKYFEEKVFLVGELSDVGPKHLAGIFAAKEAVIKALGIGAGNWKEISVSYEETGKPFLSKVPEEFMELKSYLSVSHDGDYAVAVVVFSTIS